MTLVEDEQQEKIEQKQEAWARAKKCNKQTQKCIQASMATELNPLKSQTTPVLSEMTPGPQGAVVDNTVQFYVCFIYCY